MQSLGSCFHEALKTEEYFYNNLLQYEPKKGLFFYLIFLGFIKIPNQNVHVLKCIKYIINIPC